MPGCSLTATTAVPCVQSGGLLLSDLIRFIAECATCKIHDKYPASAALDRTLINRLLARKPSAEMAQHAEERGARWHC